MRHGIKGSCQVDGHTHGAVRWFLSMYVVSWRREDVVECMGLKPC